MITVVVGAQFGGEGKGKVAAYLAAVTGPDVACRCGGPNSSHTVVYRGQTHRLRMMPTAAVVNPKISVVFGAGTLIHIPTLISEIAEIAFSGDLIISPNAGVVTDELVANQRQDERYQSIGSTLTGTGYASAFRSLRKLGLASDYPELSSYLGDVEKFMRASVTGKRGILIEGHQGFGLSNYHGDYPYVSSRDSTAAAMLSEVGLGPIQKGMQIVLATKVFPTRNHSGSLGEEISEDDATTLGICEFGGGSWGIPNRRRRVGVFDPKMVQRAAFANSATWIALTGADYFDRTLAGSNQYQANRHLDEFIRALERITAPTRVRYVSTGPEVESTYELPQKAKRMASAPAKTKEGGAQNLFSYREGS